MATNDVNSVQTSSQDLMTSQYAVVTGFLSELEAFVTTTDYDPPAPPPVDGLFISSSNLGVLMDSLTATLPPYLPNTEVPAPPTPPNAVTITAIAVENAPDFTDAPPVVTLPAVPSATLPGAPVQPTLSTPVAPSAPTIVLPTAPNFAPIAVPDPASVSIDLPVFSYDVPVSTLTEPTAVFQFNEQDYSSALSDAVKAKLIYDIENGGYGIDVSDEDALWDRARERAGVEANTLIDQALDTAASRGFPLPAGVDMAALAAAQQKALANIASVDREIALKRADMYVENRKVSLTLATEVEGLFINYRSSMMERSLNAAKALVELGIAIFNAKRDKFLADLEAFKSYASVYETKIRAELAKVEIFKARLEAAHIAVEINQAQAALYATQVQAVGMAIEVYKAQVDSARLAFDLERAKLEIFNGQVAAYTAQVQAKTAEFGLYKAQLDGQMSQVQVFEAKVQAYNSRVQGFNAKVQALVARAQGEALNSDATTKRYMAQLEQYRADLGRIIANTQANVSIYQGNVQGYLGRAGALAKAAELGISANEANARTHAKVIDQNIEVLRTRTADLLHLLDSRISATKAGTDAATRLAEAAANQITGLTSLLKDG